MNIIFLDIDGVLNTLNYLKRQKRDTGKTSNKNWCPVSCKHIGLICEYYDAKIVISSSWRHEYSMEQLRNFFDANDIPSEYLIDRTPSTAPQTDGGNYCRGHEIKDWLENSDKDIESYIIIDDEAKFLEEQSPFLIRVDKKKGFSTKDVALKASSIFDGNNR